jgi:hypothetical protein
MVMMMARVMVIMSMTGNDGNVKAFHHRDVNDLW